MTLQELQEQVSKLSIEERQQLIQVLMRSLQPQPQSTSSDRFLLSIAGIGNSDRSNSSMDIAKVEELAQRANDPEIQAEIRSMLSLP